MKHPVYTIISCHRPPEEVQALADAMQVISTLFRFMTAEQTQDSHFIYFTPLWSRRLALPLWHKFAGPEKGVLCQILAGFVRI